MQTLKEGWHEMRNEALKTITVAGLLCMVCSVIVSVTATRLKPQQKLNAEIDVKRNILTAAGMIDTSASDDDVVSTFESVETVLINLEDGSLNTTIDAKTYDQKKAAKMPDQSVKIPADKDVAGLSTRAKVAKAYLVKTDGAIDSVIVPIISKGLWSTMYGFMALAGDTNTVKGFAYYAQGETPGLGGEVDNPKWKAQWVGKKIFDAAGNVAMELAKAISSDKEQHQVDSLSGATITANGVTYSMQYWFGDHGYRKFLDRIKAGEI
jgi:Na+-transporting NADH:ubiquinone oxidoreductase subunit C